jgi:uncharacterized membrane protein YqjE
MAAEFERSIAVVLKDIVGNLQQIVRAEIRLARVEVRQEVDKARRTALLLIVGGAVTILALACALLACVCLLATVVAPWIAALVVAAAAGALGGAVIVAGMKQWHQVTIPPPRTVATLEETIQWTSTPTK